jgi:transposase InsO family protein
MQMVHMIPPSWPFAMCGLDILAPFPRADGGYRYLYVTIDKFTKWLKATPVIKINKKFVVKFIKSIVYRFGVPNKIITDNRSQFTSGAFQYCEDLGVQICFASVAHLGSNGQVKRANANMACTYDGLQKHGKNWIDELPCILWGYWTSPSRATGEMPFFLVYVAEAILPPRGHLGLPPCPNIRRSHAGLASV